MRIPFLGVHDEYNTICTTSSRPLAELPHVHRKIAYIRFCYLQSIEKCAIARATRVRDTISCRCRIALARHSRDTPRATTIGAIHPAFQVGSLSNRGRQTTAVAWRPYRGVKNASTGLLWPPVGINALADLCSQPRKCRFGQLRAHPSKKLPSSPNQSSFAPMSTPHQMRIRMIPINR